MPEFRQTGAKALQSLPNLELIAALVSRVPQSTAEQIDVARAAGVLDKGLPLLGAALACSADGFVTGGA